MNVDDWWCLPEADRAQLRDWFESVIGGPLDPAHIVEARLGEGVLECDQIQSGPDGKLHVVDHDFVIETRQYAAPKPPPVWSEGRMFTRSSG